MRLGLSLSALLFSYGVVLPLLLFAWLAVGVLIASSAGMALVHSGSLHDDIFPICTRIAAAINVVVLVGICLAWIARLAKASFFTAFTTGGGLILRHPVPLAALFLLAALGAVTAFAGNRASIAAQYATTIVVLANVYFFALLTVACSLAALHASWSRFRESTVASAYRTGVCTTMLAFVGLGGLAVQQRDWAAPAEELRAQIDLAPLLNAADMTDFQQAALCIASHEVLEARGDGGAEPPPECARVLGR
jgi:hypothetical protein